MEEAIDIYDKTNKNIHKSANYFDTLKYMMKRYEDDTDINEACKNIIRLFNQILRTEAQIYINKVEDLQLRNVHEWSEYQCNVLIRLVGLLCNPQCVTNFDTSEHKKLYYYKLTFAYRIKCKNLQLSNQNPLVDIINKFGKVDTGKIGTGDKFYTLSSMQCITIPYIGALSDFGLKSLIIPWLHPECFEFLHKKVYTTDLREDNYNLRTSNPILIKCMNDLENINRLIEAI